MSSFKERIIPFGDEQHLLGILTEPQQADSNKPVILFLNAGVVHHIGPFRMSTDFARQAADLGFFSCRIDLSGIGDSNMGQSQVAAEQRFVNDAKAAMDALQAQLGAHRTFIVFGLCTGADNAHKIAAQDDRVCGCVFLDGYAYPTPRFYWYRYGPILLSAKRVFGLLWRLVKKPAVSADEGNPEDSIFTWSLPPKEKSEAEWARMLGNGVQMLFMFTGGALYMFNHERQVFDASPALRAHKHQVSVHFHRQADHTFALAGDREKLLSVLLEWLKQF